MPTTKKKPNIILVQPGKTRDGQTMVVFDAAGRLIPYNEHGYPVQRSLHVARALKCGDLVLYVEKVKPKEKEKGDK